MKKILMIVFVTLIYIYSFAQNDSKKKPFPPEFQLLMKADSVNSLEEKENIYSEIIKINPNFYQAYALRGITRERLNKLDDALQDYQNHLKLKPINLDMHVNIAKIYNKKGLNLKAIEEYNKAISSNSKFKNAYYGIIECYIQMKDKNNALKICNTAKELFPEDDFFIKKEIEMSQKDL